jgi:hypothetical protein
MRSWWRSLGGVFVILSLCGCVSTPPDATLSVIAEDGVYRRQMEVGRAALNNGQMAAAAAAYEQARQRAHLMDQPVAAAAAAYQAGLSRAASGDVDRGRRLLAEARLLWEQADMDATEARVAEAEAAWLAGDGEAAQGMVESGLAQLSGSDQEAWIVQLLSLRAMLALQDGNMALVERTLDEVRTFSENAAASPRVTGRLLQVEAQLAEHLKAYTDAASVWDAAAEVYRQAGLYRQMGEVLAAAATAYAAADQPAAAVDRYERAARQAWASGDAVRALQLVSNAVALVYEEGATAERLALLVAEINSGIRSDEGATNDP